MVELGENSGRFKDSNKVGQSIKEGPRTKLISFIFRHGMVVFFY